jgi:2-polyprenyl-3-methyl-5-hydroxy-6-metoxy-1,4-benzoquinol methylase
MGKIPMSSSAECSVCGCPENRALYSFDERGYVCCSVCGLTYVVPVPTETEMVSRAEYWAQKYHTQETKIAQHYSADFQKVAFSDHLRRIDPYRKNGRLLDVGCGIGGFLNAAGKAGWAAFGVDVSSSALIAQGKGLNVRQSDLLTAGFEEGTFDVITLFDVVEHIPSAFSLFTEINRILRPGGCLYILTPNIEGAAAKLLGRKWEAIEPQDHAVLFRKRDLDALLRRAMFVKNRSWTIDLNIFNLLSFSRPGSLRDDQKRVSEQAKRRTLIKKVVQSALLIQIRAIINRGLGMTTLGDKLIFLAEKPERPN